MKKLIVAFSLIFLFSHIMSDAEEPSGTVLFLQASIMEEEGDYDGAYTAYQQILISDKSPTVYLKLINVELMRDNIDNAYKLLLQARKSFPDNADIAFQMGVYAATKAEALPAGSDDHNKWLKISQDAFKNAVKIEPIEKNYVALALVSMQMKDYSTAMGAYDRLINDLGGDEYYRSRSVLKLELGDKEGAIADLNTAYGKSEDVQSLIRLADIYLKDNDTDTAMGYLLKASELRPDLVVPDLYLGEIFRDKNEYERAVHFYMQAAQHMEGKVRNSVLKQIGSLALEKEDFAMALKAYNMALGDTFDDPQFFYLAGYAASNLEDGEAAQRIFDKGIELFPDYAMLRKRSAINLLIMGKPERAIEVLSKIDKVEQDVQYHLLLSNAYADLKNYNKAVEILQEGYRENPESIDIMLGLATYYEILKQHDNSISILKKAIGLEPESPVVQNFLGYVYADMGINLDEAEILIDKALEQEPGNYAYLDSKAWVLYKKGNYKEAYILLQKALEQRADDAELNEHMEKIKDKLKAVK